MTDTIVPSPAMAEQSARRRSPLPVTRLAGVALAGVTACVSGVSVFVNGYGVRRVPDPTTYTTAKNLVAALLLLGLLLVAAAARSADGPTRPRDRAGWLGLAAVAVVGGSVPFVLFFEGLSRATATQAAFIHKSLVIWVALLAVPLLRERIGPAHVAAIALVVAGQAWIAGAAGTVVFGTGEAMILAATLLWAVEVILVKRLVGGIAPGTLAAGRMGAGTLVLLAWVAVSGRGGALLGLGGEQWGWALLVGVLLSAYVATWYAALARAQAVDVTAVLVFGAVVTALLSGAADGVPLDATGVALITLGTAVAGLAMLGRGGPRLART
jgi:drug/metabolite transporter (DMT)-like permease